MLAFVSSEEKHKREEKATKEIAHTQKKNLPAAQICRLTICAEQTNYASLLLHGSENASVHEMVY